jgi:hypothetical protein
MLEESKSLRSSCGVKQKADRWFFCVNTLLACPVGRDNDFNMTIPKLNEVDPDNIINVIMEDLNDA